MIGLTDEQIERAWSNNAKMRTKFNGDFPAYKQYMQSNSCLPAKAPQVVAPKIEEPKMTQQNNTAAGEAALAQIKIWQEEDRQKASMARMSPANPEQAWRSEFAASTALQKEFRDIDVWVSYKRAQAKGLCK